MMAMSGILCATVMGEPLHHFLKSFGFQCFFLHYYVALCLATLPCFNKKYIKEMQDALKKVFDFDDCDCASVC